MDNQSNGGSGQPGVTRRSFLRAWSALPMAVVLSAYVGHRISGVTPTFAAPQSSSAAAPVLQSCVVTPQQTEGPYFVDERLNRSDIRANTADGAMKDGVPLRLRLEVSQTTADGCVPLPAATVDIWQCDALGTYSDVADRTVGFTTTGQDFLRGYQVTDAAGRVAFDTVVPGWYTGRAVHIHWKVRTDPDSETGYEATSQFYFDDALLDEIHTQPPYADNGQRDTRNTTDGIFQNGGDQLILPLSVTAGGYSSDFGVVVDLSAPAPASGPEGFPNMPPGGPGSGFEGGPPPGPGGPPPGTGGPRPGPGVQAPAAQVPS